MALECAVNLLKICTEMLGKCTVLKSANLQKIIEYSVQQEINSRPVTSIVCLGPAFHFPPTHMDIPSEWLGTTVHTTLMDWQNGETVEEFSLSLPAEYSTSSFFIMHSDFSSAGFLKPFVYSLYNIDFQNFYYLTADNRTFLFNSGLCLTHWEVGANN